MSRRNLINLVLLAVIGVLVLLVIYEPGKEEKIKTTLSTLDKNNVSKITIKRVGIKDVVLVRQGENWLMQAPWMLPANNFKAEGLLDLLAQESEAQYPLDKLDVKTYGLDKPRASITYNDSHVFEFGTTESLKNNRYIKHNNTLYVAADIFYHRMSISETDYLDHSILPGNNNIQKLELPAFTLTMNDGKWDIKPAPESWSNDQANELIENWKLSQAISISSYDQKSAKQQVKVHLQGSEQPLIFHIVKDKENFYLARPDVGLKYELSNDKERDLLELPPKVEAKLPGEEAGSSKK